ncbi:MAG: hypothetical protein NTY45_10255 [Elusimicrobia bacterium]|nr:hypothetical protein [Elusimicrobiota bacterium]
MGKIFKEDLYRNFRFAAVVLLSLSAGQLAGLAAEPPLSEAELRDSSLVGGSFCAAVEKPLFRSVRNDYFPLGRVIANMLGDETAEHVAWSVTEYITQRGWNPSDLSLDQVRLAKRAVLEDLGKAKTEYAGNPCSVALSAAIQTSGGGTLARSGKAMGILAGDSAYEAEGYATWDNGSRTSVMLEIHEAAVKRAGYAGLGSITKEWAIPVFIPHDEITAAWSYDYYVRKLPGIKGYPEQIEVRARLDPGFAAFDSRVKAELDAEREGRPLGELLYVINTCQNSCETGAAIKEEFSKVIGVKFPAAKLENGLGFQVVKVR